jgi:outer membrane protein assembly factor BamB
VAYQVDASHDGYQAREPLSTRGLTRKWTRTLASPPLGDGAEAGAVSYPVIAGGRVFVTVEASQSYGTDLFALNAETGRTDWYTGLGGTYGFSALAYDGQRVFAVNSTGLYVSYACQQDFGFHLDGLLAVA